MKILATLTVKPEANLEKSAALVAQLDVLTGPNSPRTVGMSSATVG
jgi:hypothetical protein